MSVAAGSADIRPKENTMERKIEMMETVIPQGRTLRIQDGKGLEFKVIAGCLWVTQENDVDDKVVEQCDSFRVNRNGLTLAHATKEVRIRFAYAAEAGMPTLTLGGGYREYGAGVMRSMFSAWASEIRGWFTAGTRNVGAAKHA
jgi:hypothetical protein